MCVNAESNLTMSQSDSPRPLASKHSAHSANEGEANINADADPDRDDDEDDLSIMSMTDDDDEEEHHPVRCEGTLGKKLQREALPTGLHWLAALCIKFAGNHAAEASAVVLLGSR